MAKLGFVLVHGFTGNPDGLAPLAQVLSDRFGDGAVYTVRLPGHADGTAPVFDADLYESAIADAVNAHLNKGRKPVLIGHSTGGCLAAGYLLKEAICPAMLILAGSPSRVQGDDLAKWEQHRAHQKALSLSNMARMVSYINRVGCSFQTKPFPVLVLDGSSDALVTSDNTRMWTHGRFQGQVHQFTIPGATHELFHGLGNQTAISCVVRTLSDLTIQPNQKELESAALICDIEAGASNFIASRSSRKSHVVRSPAALRALGKPIEYAPIIDTDPIQANIEITSRCNLACRHCARSIRSGTGKDMDIGAFEYLLKLIPNTYKVVLVGLGEPMLHPRVADFVAVASQRGHGVGLVTNAMAMGKNLSRQLIAAGLRTLTFSLDSMDADVASRVRPGTDLDRITHNIEKFVGLADGKISTAVFTAVSTQTVDKLPDLASTITKLGVNAWMLTDMNFHSNHGISLWKNWNAGYRDAIGCAIKLAFTRNLPVLSVRGLEELGLGFRYNDFLVSQPADLCKRSTSHRWCLSPWQTLPVNVDGDVTVCDCQPHAIVGNLFENAYCKIWNGEAMQAQRRWMRSNEPPKDCRICPRF